MYIHRHISNNYWLKLFSLVLATLIWFVISSNFRSAETPLKLAPLRPGSSRDFRRPVVVMMPARNVQPFQVEPAEVTVKVLGEQAVLNKLRDDDIEVYVNLMNVQNPHGSYRVEVGHPRELTIQQVWPAHVYVKAPTPAEAGE
ncbi:MAG TPA: CdaR family protein [Verrucomicrobiae bacterium]|nr:CdaR family protein [Verrucomicrobiae bacterium]